MDQNNKLSLNDFFKNLYGDHSPEGVLNLWTKKDKHTYSFQIQDIQDAIGKIEELKAEHDVYYEVCLQRDKPETGRGKEHGVTTMPGLWFDLDIAGENHRREHEKLPSDSDEASEFIRSLCLKPTLIVSSGGGLHLYFLFEQPLRIRNDEDRKKAKNLSSAFQKYIRDEGEKRGWSFDNTSDLSRLLRVPETSNHKTEPPKMVEVIEYHPNNRYDIDDFDFLPDEPEKISVPRCISQDYPSADYRLIEERCPWIRHCRDDAGTLPEPEWLAMLSVVGRCENGRALAHKLSSAYDGYSVEETDYKLNHTMKAGPRTCENIQNELNGDVYCSECSLNGRIKSPINAGTVFKQTSPPVFEYTDMGNAKRMAYLHGENIRYCYSRKKWLIWNGKKWEEDNSGIVRSKAKHTVNLIREQSRKNVNDSALNKHASSSQSLSKINSMIELAKSEPGINANPEMFDRDKWLLNCENGTIDLRSGILKPHSSDHLITKIVPISYQPEAECPLFMSFLDRITDRKKNIVSFIKRAIGYTLTGEITGQCLFFLHGTGANGKSTFLEVIRRMMGDYAMHTDFNTFLQKKSESVRNDLARLKGARFVTAVEADTGKRLSETTVKQITGGEPITARYLYGEYFEYYPEFKLFLAANHYPEISGSDEGIRRRIHLIPFTVMIPQNERDPNLTEKLMEELPGILSWAVKGCLEWQREGLNPPDEVKLATEEYYTSQDIIAQFVSECCSRNENEKVSKDILYTEYKKWCEKSSENILSKRAFGSKLKEKGIKEYKSTIWYWKEINICQEVSDNIDAISPEADHLGTD